MVPASRRHGERAAAATGAAPCEPLPAPCEALPREPLPREPLLWPREVAPLVGVTPKVVSQWARRGRLAYVRTIGGQRRYPRSEVVKLLRQLDHPDPERAVDEALARRR